MPHPAPAEPVRAWEVVLILLLGPPILWLFIMGFFGAMPLAERLGKAICHAMFGI